MIVQRILHRLKSTTPYICKTSCCEFQLSRNVSAWKQSLTPVLVLNLVRITNTQLVQHYARNMDKPKPQGKRKLELREDMLSEYFNVDKIKMEMHDVVEYMKEQFVENVSIRSAVGAVESLTVEYEGTQYSIRDLAQINRKNPKMVVLNFSAFPQTITTVLQALEKSGLNLNPQQDGTTVYVPIPKVTREHREKLAKSVNAIFVKCRAAVKEVQSKFSKKLELRTVNENISVEQMRLVHDQLALLADQYIVELEKIKSEKLQELLRNE